MKAVEDARRAAEDLRQSGRGADDLHHDYLMWARVHFDRLSVTLTAAAAGQLTMTPTYWALLGTTNTRGAVFTTIQAELDSRAEDLRQAGERMVFERDRWSAGIGPLVVVDTNMFLEHPLEFPEVLVDIEREIDANRPEPKPGRPAFLPETQFVIPLAVVDELDKVKHDRIRTRARNTLRALNELFDAPHVPVSVPGAHSGTTVALLLDDLGHERLPVMDEEIVDRAVYLASVADVERARIIVTSMDQAMDFRVRARGLTSMLFERP